MIGGGWYKREEKGKTFGREWKEDKSPDEVVGR
jgi:hypothetical protein